MRLVAMDTETYKGYAILITKPWAFCYPTSFDDCIEFLSHDPQMMCWNSDYDVQAILKYLPTMVRSRLGLIGTARWKNYRMKFVAHKFFKIWNEESGRLLFTIYDLRQFYACSLAKAAERLGVQRKKGIPKAWYKNMLARLIDPKTRQKVLDYALGDAQTLQQIIDRTVEAFRYAGLKFERPYSNAAFAERYFRNNFRYRRNKSAERMARRAYHGGRIECLKAGYFATAYHYDIRSAYPSMIANLVKPDGVWIYERRPETIRPDAIYAFIDCEITIRRQEALGPIPIKRKSGSIFYPVGTFRKVITLTEFRYLERRSERVKIYNAWVHIWPTWTYPFREIAEIYQRRKRDKRLDYALKIVINSVYGKMAQVIEHRIRTNRVDARSEIFDGRVWRKREMWKRHTSFVYAAEITARIRIKLIEDFHGPHVISYSTDGVFTTKPASVECGPNMGEWSDEGIVSNLVVVGSGVYAYEYYDEDQKEVVPVVKFRGFSPELKLRKILAKAGRRHQIGTKVLRNTSLKQSAKGSARALNVLEETVRYLDVNFDRKRNWEKRWSARELTERQFSSKPWVYYRPVKVPLND